MLEPFRFGNVPLFLSWAAEEGWRCGSWEFDFLLEHFPQGCWTTSTDGIATGFITSVKYVNSGWIGNLLVREDCRGRGYGRLLMEQAMDSLDRAGVKTMWLTASRAGQPLYEKLGFIAIDRISRWRGSGIPDAAATPANYLPDDIESLDRHAWGDTRRLILDTIAAKATVVGTADGFCMVQGTEGALQLGPWSCRNTVAAEDLLEQALTVAGPAEIFLDVPDSNDDAAFLLRKWGFAPCSGTILMYRGALPSYQPQLIYALASMGSMG
nr:GNAT family N-acetyltransferase [Geotalea sp. SG265]